MEEIEIPTEQLQESIKEKAEEQREKGEGKLTLYIAVCTALMAVFAAMAGLMAGDHSNEALIDQIKSSDQWAFYQAKSIKAEVRLLQTTPLGSNNKSAEDTKKEEGEIKKSAEDYEHSSEAHLKKHIWLARSVTFFQVAIAISAMSILTKKKFLWFAGVLTSLIGLALFILGLFI
jgi:hypothetical protein